MPAPFRRLSVAEFAELLARFPFTRRINQVHMHHTWSPARRDWRGAASVQAMRDFHVKTNGWSDIAQHVTIAPDGGIWTGRNWNQAPASSGGFNGTSATGPFMFETVGNFDVGRDPFDGPQRDAVLEVIARVQLRFGLPVESLHFHRQLNSPKTCPGSAISYQATLDAVRAVRARLSAAPRDLGMPEVARAPFGDDALAADQLARELAAARVPGQDPPDAEPHEELSPAGLAGDALGAAAAAPAPAGTRGGAAKPPALTPAQLQALRPHVVNLAQGQWSTDGAFQTSQADADAIVDEHLPAALAAARGRGEPLRVLVFAHGGLVDEASGLGVAHKQCAWWTANGVYPLFFVWETGLAGTVKQLLGEAGRRMGRIGARDLWDRTSDPLVEMAARALGGAKIWGGMKWSAERASAPGGGARHVAERLGAFAAAANAEHAGSVELHAVGHSAGSIFHAHFLPRLLEAMGTAGGAERVDSLHLLAPAARADLYADALLPLVEDGRVARCAMFTMAQDWERADNCNGVYRKSLLYLVSRAFERERPSPILGLEESVRGDARLRAHFGLAGGPGAAEVVWAKTDGAHALAATTSTSHGGFDDDAPTMESVLRRVLGDADGTRRIQPFPATRSIGMADDAWPEELAWAAAVTADGAAPMPAPMPTAAPVDAFAGAAGGVSTAAQMAVDDVVGPDAEDADDGLDDDDDEDAAADPTEGVGAAADARERPTPAPAVAPSATTPSRRGRRRALCVGIDSYPAAPLAGCVADARLWERTLAELGFDRVKLLTDGMATRAAILDELGRLLRTSRRGDVVVFQYSGHGTQVPDVDGDEGDSSDEALVPVDYADGEFLVDDDLRAVLARTPAGVNVTCFMDCCHSGTNTRLLLGPPAAAGAASTAPGALRPRFLNLPRQAPEALAAYVARRKAEGAAAPAAPAARGAAAAPAPGSRAAMRSVLFSACLSTEVAFEQNGQGDFTRLATPLLRDAVRDGMTHLEFRARVRAAFRGAFGNSPRQNPTLDCAPAAQRAPLLQPVPAAPGARSLAALAPAEGDGPDDGSFGT